MVSDPVLQWLLTAVFTAAALYSGFRLVTDRRGVPVVGNALHVIMSVVMVAMCWPWWNQLPMLPQIIIFSIGTLWFLGIIVAQSALHKGRSLRGDDSVWHHVSHVAMMLAMVWMVVVMLPGSDEEASGGGHDHHHGGLDLWASLSGVIVTAALVTFGAVFAVKLIHSLRRGDRTWLSHTGDVASGAAMSLGMAAMCWPMIAG